MDNWTLEKLLKNDSQLEKATNNGDCYLLYQSPPKKNLRSYTLCKIVNFETYAFVMLIEGDTMPILLSTNDVLEFLNNPEKAERFAYSIWFDRYR